MALTACDRRTAPAPRFKGLDVTGVTFAQGFKLLDSEGRTRTLEDFRGKIVMIFFGFTQCPDVCPTALFRATEIKRLLGSDGPLLQVLFVTVDPERDTSDILAAYMRAFDPSFIGLHTDLKGTAEVAKEYKIFYAKVPTGSSYTMDHSAISYVYDTSGRVRVVFPHSQSAEDCAADIRLILKPT